MGDTIDWSYSTNACEIKDKIKELVTNSCTEYNLSVTLSELPPFHLDSPNCGYDKIYANLVFAHLGGTNQMTVYVETVSRVYISDFYLSTYYNLTLEIPRTEVAASVP